MLYIGQIKQNMTCINLVKMSNLWIVISFPLFCFFGVIYGDYGEGIWEPMSIEKCEEQDHKFKYDLQLIKRNNTHDEIKGHIVYEETFTKKFGIRVVVYKCDVDECKQTQMVQENCLVDFLNKYAKQEFKNLLVAGGVDPPEAPIEKGEYEINDYMVAKKQGIGAYGSFEIKTFVLEEDKEVGCVAVKVDFNKLEG